MLIGCCHCGSESEPSVPSESFPPSESSGPSPPQTIIGNCSPLANLCINDEAPLMYGINVSSVGGTAPCRASYAGAFTLIYSPSSCFTYRTAERAKNQDAACADLAGTERWRLIISGGTNFGLQGLFQTLGFVSAAVSYSLAPGGSDINCVQSFTLNRTAQAAGWTFPATLQITPL